jgi:Mg chelatase-related protein
MLAIVKSYALEGIEGYPVSVEVDAEGGIPSFDVVGLAGTAIKESRNRVRAAIANMSFDFIPKRVTVNLAPADIKKGGSAFDFPIAIGFLAGTGQIPTDKLSEYIMIGELSLDGSIRKVNGVTPILIDALKRGFKKFIISRENIGEASYIEGIDAFPVKDLSEAAAFLGGIVDLMPAEKRKFEGGSSGSVYDISDIKGQSAAKRALEIAVAGGHNLIMCGPPGAGKTMLARAIPSIMPDMTFEEAIETTKIHSVAGALDGEGIVKIRPFRSPHHTASLFSLTGGGSNSAPGEISLAHNGVLFLDELPEYPPRSLEALRQPLEDGSITVARVARTLEYPARFMLVASMNPCPCGYDGSRFKDCACTPLEKKRYRSRISGPLLDRIDVFVDVDGVEYSELRGGGEGEKSSAVKKRIEAAREIERARFKGFKFYTNSRMSAAEVRKFCPLPSDAEMLLKAAFERFKLSARGVARIIKVARTIADLRLSKDIGAADLAEAVQFRVRNAD